MRRIVKITNHLIIFPFTFLDCPSNSSVLPTLAATKPQHNTPNADNKLDNKGIHNLDGFLRHLTNSQFHSYSAALAITIGVGCFLLLLNILIFAGIYYQRVKRTLDAKRKEEFVESADIMLPNFIDRCMEKAGEKGALSMPPYTSNLGYDEYNRYVEKARGSVCGVGPPMEHHKCKLYGKEQHVEFVPIRTPEKSAHISISNSAVHPQRFTTYPSPQLHSSLSEPDSSNSSEMVTYQYQHSGHKDPPTEHCNQSTQSDFNGTHDVGTTVTESDVDDRHPHKSDEGRTDKILSTPSSLRSSISTSNYQGGILRQQQLGPTTPSTSKKRVQIQEISV